MANKTPKPPRATWGENVILADFGARRRQSLEEFQPTATKIPTEPEGWAAAQLMEGLADRADTGRLARGREYYRAGRVIGLELETNVAVGLVSGSQLEPFEVSLRMAPISNKRREFLNAELHSEPSLLRTIISGSAPPVDIATMLLRPDQLRNPSCTCPDNSPVCKHAIAVGYMLAARFNRDPASMLQWRGINAGEALHELARLDQSRGATSLNSPEGSAGAGSDWDGVHRNSENTGAEEVIDQEEFWGSEQRRVSWPQMTTESGIEQGDKEALMAALRSISWTSVDQLQTHYELEICYEALTDDSGQFSETPWFSQQPTFNDGDN